MTEAIKIKSKGKRPLSDDVLFMLELFEARPKRTNAELVRIYDGNQNRVTNCLRSLRNHGIKLNNPKMGEWEMVGDV